MFFRRFSHVQRLVVVGIFIFLFSQLQMAVQAAGELMVEQITWDVIGLDSNKPSISGPEYFPVGVRVCNRSGATVNNLAAKFVWDSVNSFVDIRPGTRDTLSVASLANDACTDFYFEVKVDRTTSAYDTTRQYHIEVTSTETGAAVYSTPIPRELYIEHLVSQNRNAVTDVQFSANSDCSVLGDYSSVAVGESMSLNVDSTYCIKVIGSTATNGYEQIESFITLPNTIFQVLSVETTYTADSSAYIPDPNTAPLHKKLYGDACQWENDPNSPNYLACNDVGKAGGGVVVTYQVHVLSAPSAPLVNPEPLTTLLYDFSGSSFHYNSDFGVSARYIYVVDPALVTIKKQFVPDSITPGGTSTLMFTITNPMPTTVNGVRFNDSFPTSPAAMTVAGTPNVSYSGCGTGAFSPALSGGEASISFTNGSIAPNSTCTIKVDVSAPSAGDYLNTTGHLFIDDTTDTGNSASDTLSAAAAASCTPGQMIAQWTIPLSAASPTVINPPDKAGGAPTTQAANVSTATALALAPARTDISTTLGQGDTYSWVSWGFKTPVQQLNFVIDTSKYSQVSMSFYEQADGNGPTNITVASSADGFANPVAITPTVGSFTLQTIDFSGKTNTAGTTTFRITGTGAQNDNSGANLFLDNITFTGCAETDPPPTVSKSFAPDTLPVNGISVLTFTINNTNPGAVALTGVQLSDTLPSGLQIASTPNASTTCIAGVLNAPAGGSTISLIGASMTVGGSCSIQVDVVATKAGQFDNISGYISSNQSGPNKSTGGYATDTLTAIAAPILSKSFVESPIRVGDTTSLSFTLTNPNQATALTGVAFTDTLPVGVDVATASSAQCGGTLDVTDNDPAADTIVLSSATIAANSSCTFDITVTGSVVGDYTNTTSNITSTNGGSGNTASSDLIVNPVTPQPTLLKQIGPTASGPWSKFLTVSSLPEDTYYRFVIENGGNVNLTSINVTDPTLGMNGDMTGCSFLTSDDPPVPFSGTLTPGDYVYCVYGPVTAASGSHTNTATAHATYGSVAYDSNDSAAAYGTTGLTLVKAATPNYFTTAGDILSYSYEVKNSGYADLLGPVTVTDDKVSVTCPDVSKVGDGDAWFDQGESITCTSSADYVVTGTNVTNGVAVNIATATVDGVNSNTVAKRVSLIEAVKSLVATSENSTSGSNVAIGEVVRYRAVADLSEGTTDALAILDNIVTNMSYLNDGQTRVAFVSNGGGICNVTSSDTVAFPSASSGDWCKVGDETTLAGITPTFVLPASTISNNSGGATTNPFPNGDDPLFSLGDITNADSDANEEFVVIEFNALVRNYVANQSPSQRGNTFTIQSDGSDVATSNNVQVTIVEPVISGITKSATTTPTDAGDQIVYTLEFTNTGDGPAFDIVLTDALNSVLTGGTVTVAGSTTGGACGSTTSTVSGSFTSPTAIATVSCLNPAGTATLTITADVSDTAEAGYSFTNSASLTYTSLPGTGTASGSNPTGSSATGGSGDSDGERNGSGGTNDYTASSNTVTTTLATPSLAKTINPAFTQFPVGRAVPYEITITIPEGVLYNAVLTDNIPAGLTYVTDSLSITFGADVSSNAIPPYGNVNVSGQTLSLDFDTLTSTASNSATNRTVTIAFDVTVDNIVANQSGSITFTNATSLVYDDPNSAGQLTLPASAPAISVVEPDLNVSKNPSTTTPAYNSTLTYTLTVEHDVASDAPAFDVAITDTMPSGLTGLTNIDVISDDGGGACALGVDDTNSTGTVLNVRVGTIPEGCTVTITYDVTVSGSLAGTQTNDVNVTWTSLSGSVGGERTGADGPGGALNDYAATTSTNVTVSGPDLRLTKTDSVTDYTPGNNLTYTVEVFNDGNLTATGTVVDDFSAQFFSVSWTCVGTGGATCTAGPVTTNINDSVSIPTGEKVTYTVTVNVSGTATGDIDNTATAILGGGYTDPTPANNSATDTDTSSGVADYTINKTASAIDTAGNGIIDNAGELASYRIEIENTGTLALTTVNVTDSLISLTRQADNPGNNDNTLDVGELWVYTGSYTVTQADLDNNGGGDGDIDNSASVTSDQIATPRTSSAAVPLTQSASLVLTKTGTLDNTVVAPNSESNVGDTITYSFSVENTGNVTITNVTVTDPLLPTLSCTIASLTPGANSSCMATGNVYVLTQTDIDTGTHANTAMATGKNLDNNDVTDQDTKSVTLISNPSLSFDKVYNGYTDNDTSGTLNLGDMLSFTLTMTNMGNTTLTNVVVSDSDLTPNNQTCASVTLGGTCVLTGTYVVQQADVDVGQFQNMGSVSDDDVCQGAGAGTCEDSVTTPITNSPALTLEKALTNNADEDSSSDVSLNDTLTFTVTMRNTGDTTLTNVVVSDPKLTPNSQTCASVALGGTCVLTGTYVVQQADVDAGQLQNTGSVNDDDICPGARAVTCEDMLTTPVAGNPAITVTKTLDNVTFDSPQLVRMTYSILVENVGDVALSNLQVTDDLATAFAQASSFSVISLLPGTFTVNANYDGDTDTNLLAGTDTLMSRANGTITLVVLADTGGKAQNYRNTAIAIGQPPAGGPVSDNDFADGPAFVDPAVTKAVSPDQAAVGDQVTFTITVFNNGTQPAADVVVTDTFPDSLDLVPGSITVTPPVNATNPPDYITITPPRTVVVRLGTLDVNDVYVITAQAVVNNLGQQPIQNQVVLSTNSPTPWASNLAANDQSMALLNITDDPGVRSLPDTGFAPHKVTVLPAQPADLAYTELGDVWLEIPSQSLKTSIIGVPRSDGAWNLDWLWEQAGWLRGTAFPALQGNSVLTGHVYLPNGKPGPFVNLNKLRWGDQIIVHTFGQRYIYQVHMKRVTKPDDLSALEHTDSTVLTLITCRSYDENSDSYQYRVLIRAVLIKIEPER